MYYLGNKQGSMNSPIRSIQRAHSFCHFLFGILGCECIALVDYPPLEAFATLSETRKWTKPKGEESQSKQRNLN